MPKLLRALLLIALLVGIARVAAHIHHPIDIVGSFVIAALSVALVQLASRLWRHSHSRYELRPRVDLR